MPVLSDKERFAELCRNGTAYRSVRGEDLEDFYRNYAKFEDAMVLLSGGGMRAGMRQILGNDEALTKLREAHDGLVICATKIARQIPDFESLAMGWPEKYMYDVLTQKAQTIYSTREQAR
jgi:hypothetical protein